MNSFEFSLSGFPALLLVFVLCYVFIYLPIKLVTILLAHGKKRTDKMLLMRQRSVIAEYEPPENLGPAAMGFLYDTKLNMAEVFATIVSLEQRQLVEIKNSGDYLIIVDTKEITQPLDKFDQYILSYLKKNKDLTITKKFLVKLARQANPIIKEELEAKGYLVPAKEQVRRSSIRLSLVTVILLFLTLLTFRPRSAEAIIATIIFLFFFSPLYLLASIFLYTQFQKITGQPWLGTHKLKLLWSDIEGYRSFIKLVEIDNLQFDSENTTGFIKNKSLPYAIALGFNTGWRQQIK